MWRESIGYAATVLAVVNGLIAMAIALLPVRTSVHKLRLGAIALGFAVIALGATAYTKYHARSEIQRVETTRGEIRRQLATFIMQGRTILADIRDEKKELPARAADEWALRAENYLRDKLGEAYAARFRREDNELLGDDLTLIPSRLAYWRAVRNRVVALEAIHAEYPEPKP